MSSGKKPSLSSRNPQRRRGSKRKPRSPVAMPKDIVTTRVPSQTVRRTKSDALAFARAKRVLSKHKAQLLSIPGVQSVEVCRKVTRGEVTTAYSVTVLVGRKIPVNRLRREEVIPRVLGGVPIDVQPVAFRATGCSWLGASLRKRRPAMVGGLSIGDVATGGAATVTAMVRGQDDQAFMGLTAGHAVTDAGIITQPAGGVASQAVGTVTDIELSELMDAALFQIDPHRRPAAGGVAGLGGPTKIGALSSSTDFVPVIMAGACSGWVYGKARRIEGPVQIDYGQGTSELRDQILVYPVPSGRTFNQAGDSGAMLLSADGTEAIGMVIAALIDDDGVSGMGLATPLDRILQRFGVSLLRATV